MRKLKLVTPGKLWSEVFLQPLGISQYRLAKVIGVPVQRIGEIVAGKRLISADTDLRLCRFFGLSNGYGFFGSRGTNRYVPPNSAAIFFSVSSPSFCQKQSVWITTFGLLPSTRSST
jgi:antitoxin HigA-1